MRSLATISLLCFVGVLLAYLSWGTDSGTKTLFQPVSEVAAEPLPVLPPNDFKKRHAKFGINCAACHGLDQSITVPTVAACFQCHGSYAEVAELTKKVHPNPHHSHMGEVSCDQCHKEHEESRLSCNQCHVFEMNVP